MNIYKKNVYKYGVPVFDSHEDYMRCIYSGDPERFGRIMGAVYYMVDTDITRRYRIYSIPKQGLELRFKDEEHAMWFKLAKGRFVK